MSNRPPVVRRLLLLLVGTYVFAVGYVVVYVWLTVHSYTRIVFQPQAAESGIALRDCRAVPTCAPDAYDLVHTQESILNKTIMVVRGTAWLVTLFEVMVLVLVTISVVAALRRYRPVSPTVVRFVDVTWRAQAAVVGALLLVYAALLVAGFVVLGDTPAPAAMVTFSSAFSSPFFDVGTLYYLVWFVAMNAAAIALNRALARSLQAWRTTCPSGVPSIV
jgi:hypothetical protein